VALTLNSKPGIVGASVRNIPENWDATWFRNFINNMLKGGDVRNAQGTNGVVVSGTISSPYATITFNPTTTTTVAPAAGSAGALPATPAGYVTIQVNGVARKVAYY
jgi:hypothetical protein